MYLPPRFAGACVVICLCGLLYTSADARTAVVHLKDRETPITGELVSQDAETVVVRVEGIDTPIPRSNVDRIEWKLSPAEQFTEKRNALKATDIVSRYNLAEWAYKQNVAELDVLAKADLLDVLKTKPDLAEVKLLIGLIDTQIKKREREARTPQVVGPGDATNPNGTADPSATDEPAHNTTMGEDDRNRLKVLLVDLSTKPRILIPDKAVRDFAEEFREHPAMAEYGGRQGLIRFMRLSADKQLQVFFDAKARSYYPKVQVRQEPKPLEDFRIKWNPHLVVRHHLRYFSEELKPARLLEHQPNGEASAYTNLIQLHRTSIKGKPLIDSNQPRQSLLLQWALPREEATIPAPEVRGYRPYFTGLDDPRVAEFETWVKSFYRYGDRIFSEIEFQPTAPAGDDATEPAADPAAETGTELTPATDG